MCYAAPVELDTDLSADTKEAVLIDGKAIAQTIRKEVAAEVAKLHDKYGKVLLRCVEPPQLMVCFMAPGLSVWTWPLDAAESWFGSCIGWCSEGL